MPPLLVDIRGITKDIDGMIRVDGIILFRVIERDGKKFVQVKDYDRKRIKCRHSYFVEVPIDIFISRISNPAIEAPEPIPGVDDLDISV